MTHVRTLIVGAGFSGIGMAVALRDAGMDDFVVLEKAAAPGGTWRENTYPGCACDVPSAVYSFSFEPNPDWSHVYAHQPEIEAYLNRTVERRGLAGAIRFGTELLAAEWDEADSLWRIETNRGAYTADVLIAGAGPLHQPVVPDLPGLDRFEGTVFHSAEWRHEHDLCGERVAVVGTGASAIQFVPRIQPTVGRMHLFQRTAPWVLPKLDHRIGSLEKAVYRRIPGAQRTLRELLYHGFELVQLAQRHPRAMQQLERIARLHLRRSVPDPELREALTPSFVLGCKRILQSNDYYPAITADNVEVVTHPVRELGANSVSAADGIEREVDTIIFGTGFHATDPPIAKRVRGREGSSLEGVWHGSPQAYLGTTIAGFPNAFLVIGPNLGNGHSSAIVLIEAQARYIVDALRTMDAERLATVEPRAEIQERWNRDVQEALAGTVWNAGGCSSYYLDANGRNSAIYPWTTLDLRRRLRSFDRDAFATTSRADTRSRATAAA